MKLTFAVLYAGAGITLDDPARPNILAGIRVVIGKYIRAHIKVLTDVDDFPTALLHHYCQNRLCHIEYAMQVNI